MPGPARCPFADSCRVSAGTGGVWLRAVLLGALGLGMSACGGAAAGEVVGTSAIPTDAAPAASAMDIEGAALAIVGDLAGDGAQVLAVGSPNAHDALHRGGAVRFFSLTPAGVSRESREIWASEFDPGAVGTELFGYSLAAIGDLDGDGIADLAVGAAALVTVGGSDEERGDVWILFLDRDGSVKRSARVGLGPNVSSDELHPLDRFGASLAWLGDVDGDGITDLAVGVPYDDDGATDLNVNARYSKGGGQNRGAVWIVFLHADGSAKAAQKISATSGGLAGPLAEAGYFGSAVAGLGDLDGDGTPDLAVGAPYAGDARAGQMGLVWILCLKADGTVKREQRIGDGDGGLRPSLDSDAFGCSLASLGDIDHDGGPDIAVGAEYDKGKSAEDCTQGAVWILHLDAAGQVRSQLRIGDDDGGFTARMADCGQFGCSLAWWPFGRLAKAPHGLGVVAGELLVGARQEMSGDEMTGKVWLLDLARGSGR
jgi:FG-GAP repeat